jgi:hypothetical protein
MTSFRCVSATVLAAFVLAATVSTRAQQPAQQTAPAGPLAPEKYKNI